MNKEQIEQDFCRIIEIGRESLGFEEPFIPPVDLDAILPDFWDEWFNPLLERWSPQVRLDLRNFFLHQMELHPDDLAVRYAALAVYSGLIQYLVDPECFAWAERPYPSQIRAFREESAEVSSEDVLEADGVVAFEGVLEVVDWKDHARILTEDALSLLHFVDTADLVSWREIRWEISNSCLMEDWDRAFQLYARATQVGALNDWDLQIFLGQFHFQLAFWDVAPTALQSEILRDNPHLLRRRNAVLHPYNWEPQLYGSPESLSSLLFYASGLIPLDTDFNSSAAEPTNLREAISKLEGARCSPRFPQPYGAVLARCYISSTRNEEGAAEYERVLQQKRRGLWSQLSPYLYRAVASSYVLWGDSRKAISALQLCSLEFPHEVDVYLKTAELQAGNADYFGVRDTIRQAAERTLAGEDWRYSSLLALGEIQTTSRPDLSAIQREIENDKPTRDRIDSLLRDYWPRFGELTEIARKEWVDGVQLLHFIAVPELAVKARLAFVTALELELKERAFKSVRQKYLVDENFRKLAGNLTGELNRDEEPFAQFLTRGTSLTLGATVKFLSLTAIPKSPLFRAFRGWLQERHPGLVDQINLLRHVTEFRNEAAHEGTAGEDSERVPEECRRIIDLIR